MPLTLTSNSAAQGASIIIFSKGCSLSNISPLFDFIREKWGVLLDEKFIQKILRSKDFIKEEYGPVIGGGPPPLIPPQYKSKISKIHILKVYIFIVV